jgi:UDP-N-acetylmuramyl tripeptide synthase
MKLELDEVRRLTGPNLLSDHSGAIIDVLFDGIAHEAVVKCWQQHVHICQLAVNWKQPTFHRFYSGGASMSIAAPMDQLYSACDLIELAWDRCVEQLLHGGSPDESVNANFSKRLSALRETIQEERKPALLSILQQARVHKVLCLADDDEVSLGSGPSAVTWSIDDLPATKRFGLISDGQLSKASENDIDWSAFSNIPLALITGTNGKSTSVRLAAEIAKYANINAGVTSTDFIKVGDTLIDEGDYSGPGGARMLLRDNRTEMAFLEVARGGLLRRGLPVHRADAALVTNVAGDHLGQYGINTVDEIAQVKLMVAKAIDNSATLVLNADDPLIVQHSAHLTSPICWFSTNKENTHILQAIEKNQACVYVENNQFIYHHSSASSIANIDDVPMTMNGTANYNIQNALGVIGLCKALHIPEDAIAQGLKNFGKRPEDNPGRGNRYIVNDIQVIVDFAHNAHSMQAIIDMASQTHANKKHVMFSHAGDRSDQEIIEVANIVKALSPSTYVLAEIEKYLRGRAPNEISELVQTHLVDQGVPESDITISSNPLAGSRHIMERAQAGDLVLLFVLSDREKVQTYLSTLD